MTLPAANQSMWLDACVGEMGTQRELPPNCKAIQASTDYSGTAFLTSCVREPPPLPPSPTHRLLTLSPGAQAEPPPTPRPVTRSRTRANAE